MSKSQYELDLEIHHALQGAVSFLGRLSEMSIHRNSPDGGVWFSVNEGQSVYWSDIRKAAVELTEEISAAMHTHGEQMTRHGEMRKQP